MTGDHGLARATQRRKATKANAKATPPAIVCVCQVEGCTRRLSREKEYYQRYRVCKFHSTQNEVLLGGEPHRFCQQCCAFQHLSCFEGARRSCRERLLLHNNRRKQRLDSRSSILSEEDEEATADDLAATDAAHDSRDLGALHGSPGMKAEPRDERSQSPTDTATDLSYEKERQHAQRHAPAAFAAYGASYDKGGVEAERDHDPPLLTTWQAKAPSLPSREPGGNSSALSQEPGAYGSLRSQSAQFLVSDVADMWARDDQVFGDLGDLAVLDELNPFATLSIHCEDLALLPPPDAAACSGSLDDVCTTATAASSRRGSYNVGAPGVGEDSPHTGQDPPQTSCNRPNGVPPNMHPAAAALSRSWTTAAQQPASLPYLSQLVPHQHSAQQVQSQPQPQPGLGLQWPCMEPSPTATLMKRHWSETCDQPKEKFARVSWGSGGTGTTPVKARRDVTAAQLLSGYPPMPLPPLSAGASAGPASTPLPPPSAAAAAFPHHVSHDLGSSFAAALTDSGVADGCGSGARPPRPPAVSLPAYPATSESNSGGSGGPAASGGPAGSGGPSLLQVHSGALSPVEQRPLLPDPFANRASAVRQGSQSISPRLQPLPAVLPSADMPASQLDAALESTYGLAIAQHPPSCSADLQPEVFAAPGGGLQLPGADAWRQDGWPALQTSLSTSMSEPVQCSVVIGGRSLPMATPNPFAFAAERRGSIRANSAASTSSAEFMAAHLSAAASLERGGSGQLLTAGMLAHGAAAAPQPFNPYSTVRRRTADSMKPIPPVPAQQLTPLWATRADLEKPR